MAITPLPSTSALAVKTWSKMDWVDIYKRSYFGNMMRRGTIMEAPELATGKTGDQVTFSFVAILTGIGTGEGGTLTGNEESLNLQSDTMTINVLRHAVANPNDDTIEQQRTFVNFASNARKGLRGWLMSRIDAGCFNQLAGVNSTTMLVDTTTYSGSNRLFVQGLNSVRAPSTNRVIRPGGAANDQSLTSADTFNLDLIDAAVESAATVYPTLEPLDGDEYDLYISPQQLTDLKRNTSAKIQWYTNEIATIMGGKTENNSIRDMNNLGIKPVGKYANVNIYSAYRVAYGQNSSDSSAITTVRRAVLVGRNALAFASRFPGALTEGGDVPAKYFTQLKDYDYDKGIELRFLGGLRKIQFQSTDIGVITIPTYAASHTS